MKVCAVIVTYGDRFHYLEQVMNACFEEGVDKIIVVDNASTENSRNRLRQYEENHKDKVKVIYLDENTGSAGGYKIGLEEAYKCEDCEFIWLLDDDNKPISASLKILLDFWNSLEIENKEKRVALLSYRYKRARIVAKSMTLELALGSRNSFLGFHIKELHKKIYRYFRRISSSNWKEDNIEQNNAKCKIVPVASYGGLFFHKELLDEIGYPDENLYLYEDNTDWTYRITKIGGKIYLIINSKIEDLELSSHFPISLKQTHHASLAKGDPFKVYYYVRNRVIFEKKNLVNCKVIYWINMVAYLTLIGLSSKRNLRLIIKAIKHGFKEKLGKLEDF